MKMLNLGCGNRYSKDWVNVDFVSSSLDVITHNLTTGIPFADNHFDVVYHSHVLEHFSKEDGAFFIKECYRVLKSGGIIRIAVPDLENISKSYIDAVAALEKEISPENYANHEWATLELIDQMVRMKSGGEMGKYWQRSELLNIKYVEQRVGHEVIQYRKNWLSRRDSQIHNIKAVSPSSTQKLKKIIKDKLLNKIGLSAENINKAKFRFGGEVHQWMYDRFSLKQILESASFSKVMVKDAFNSSIVGWEKYVFLDIENGMVRKPDSLFMEAIK